MQGHRLRLVLGTHAGLKIKRSYSRLAERRLGRLGVLVGSWWVCFHRSGAASGGQWSAGLPGAPQDGCAGLSSTLLSRLFLSQGLHSLSSGLAVHARWIELGFGRGRPCHVKPVPPPRKQCLVNISLGRRAAVQRTGGWRAKWGVKDRGSGARRLIRAGSAVLSHRGSHIGVREAARGGRGQR